MTPQPELFAPPALAAPPRLAPPVCYVFVDFENVHEVALEVFRGEPRSLTLLLGPRQTKLDAALVEKLLEHAASVQLVRLASSGKNALDFTLAYYVGRAAAADPTGHFHIISKDTGFDPLIEHLRSRHVNARRHDDFTTLPGTVPAKPAPASTPSSPTKPKPSSKPKTPPPVADDPAARVLEHLRKHPTSLPRRKKTLVSHLVALSGRKSTDAEVLELIESLRQAGHLAIDAKDGVTYQL